MLALTKKSWSQKVSSLRTDRIFRLITIFMFDIWYVIMRCPQFYSCKCNLLQSKILLIMIFYYFLKFSEYIKLYCSSIWCSRCYAWIHWTQAVPRSHPSGASLHRIHCCKPAGQTNLCRLRPKLLPNEFRWSLSRLHISYAGSDLLIHFGKNISSA